MSQQTTGVGVPTQIAVDSTSVTLSLSGTTTHQITATIEDAAGNPLGQLTLTAAANASAGTTVYTGTITGGASNALAGITFVVAGFDTTANNGTFVATASSTTTLTLANAAGVADTHAGTATPLGFNASTSITYSASGESAGNPSGSQQTVVSVSGSGLITGNFKGQATVEVSYPFANATGTIVAAGVTQPINKIYKLITVQVNA